MNNEDEGNLFHFNRVDPMTDGEFRRIARYMSEHYGIEMKDKRSIVEGRLENHVGELGYHSYTEIMNAAEHNPKGPEDKLLVDILTTNYTYFMREFEHFEFWKNEVLPELKRMEEHSRDLRVWCGASSTGEEPYTIAMVLSDYFGLDSCEWDTGILATEESVQALETEVRGIYPMEKIDMLPYGWKERYFRRVDSGYYQAVRALRKKITFSKLNLMDQFLFKKKMHTIFMKNVMIYFDNETRIDLLNRVYDVLEPGGYLFIGMTENIDRNRTGFEYVRPAVYRKPFK